MCIDVVLSLFSSEEKVSRSGRIIKPKKRFIEEVEEEKQEAAVKRPRRSEVCNQP